MDKIQTAISPNMDFLSDLTPDLKIKYFELLKEANSNLKELSLSLNEMYTKQKNLLLTNMELSVENSKLKGKIGCKEDNELNDQIDSSLETNFASSQKLTSAEKKTVNKNIILDETYCSDPELDFE